ncbi:MAG TPA: hypothetical protein VKR80_02930 [Candidatus Limnocylindria bacterium]|nr:hypothetical protein [Candidatus Limnocylindria bacterium]
MRVIRGAILAIVATLGLALGIASTAYADEGGTPGRPAAAASSGPTSSAADPGDPGLPPD